MLLQIERWRLRQIDLLPHVSLGMFGPICQRLTGNHSAGRIHLSCLYSVYLPTAQTRVTGCRCSARKIGYCELGSGWSWFTIGICLITILLQMLEKYTKWLLFLTAKR